MTETKKEYYCKPILFRAVTMGWEDKNEYHPNRFIYGYYIYDGARQHCYISEIDKEHNLSSRKLDDIFTRILGETLCQYVDCVDSKGVKVFEYDIVTVNTVNGRIDGIVKFSKDDYRWVVECKSIGLIIPLDAVELMGFEVRYNTWDEHVDYVEYRTKDTI